MIPSQNFFKIATVLAGVAVVGLLGYKITQPSPGTSRNSETQEYQWGLAAAAPEADDATVMSVGMDVNERLVAKPESEFNEFVSPKDRGTATESLTALTMPEPRLSKVNLAEPPSSGPKDTATPAELAATRTRAAAQPESLSVGRIGQPAGPRQPATANMPVLSVGRIGSAPTRESLLSIDRLPTSEAEVSRAFAAAADRANRILPPNGDVIATLQRSQGQSGTLGRVTAMTIGLKLNADAAGRLPGPTRTQVLDYFDDHRLAVQPIVYHDAEGQPYFGTDTASAFYRVDLPGRTLRPEPMIIDAVSRFRTLGLVSDNTVSLQSGSSQARTGSRDESTGGRTLAMAFSYSQAITEAANAPTRTSVELLLLHLPMGRPAAGNRGENVVSLNRDDRPNIDVFITSDDRTLLHQVLGDSAIASGGGPAMSAEVRFDDSTMLGLYPARPVVTRINYRRGGSISMSIVERFMDASTPVSLPAILDRFTDLAKAPITTEDPMERLRRQRMRQLDETLKKSSQSVDEL